MTRGKLFLKATVIYILALLTMGAILFIPAGTFEYWNAWAFLAVVFIPTLFVLFALAKKDPELLQKRMQYREKEPVQRKIIGLSLIGFIAGFILPGFDYRYHWSAVPFWLVIFSGVIVFMSYILCVIVFKQNSYASRIVEIQKGQKLIDTGLYAIVRHPMYFAVATMYIFSPLMLGSFYAVIPMLSILITLQIRMNNEEKVLKEGLTGYGEYMKRVRYRMIPHVW